LGTLGINRRPHSIQIGEEIQSLNRITTMFLDYAEDRAARRLQITMVEWSTKTDEFLAFNDRQVLRNAGSVSNEKMKQLAGNCYDRFDQRRKTAELEAAEAEHVEELRQIVKRHLDKKDGA
jgi:hypothetical protein